MGERLVIVAWELPAHIAYTEQLPGGIKYNLSSSSAAIKSIAEIAPNAIEQITDLPLSYASIRGDERLRKELIRFAVELNPSTVYTSPLHCLTFCGAQEAIQAVYHTLLAPEDEVVLVSPCYPSLFSSAKRLGAQVKTVLPKFESGWHCPIEQVIAAVSDKTKLIVINSPHNPTGLVYTLEQHRVLLDVAKHYGCYILSDDVSQASNFDHVPIEHPYLSYEKAISIGVLSKSFGLPGIRVGWSITACARVNDKLLAYKCANSICTSRIDEIVAIDVLQQRHKIITDNNQTIKHNIECFDALVSSTEQLEWQSPEAGILSLVKYCGDEPFEHWLNDLAFEHQILALPSSLFGLNENFFRLGLGQKDFSSSMAALARALEK